MRTPHSSCRKGKKVRIVKRSGEVVITKFIENKSHKIITEAGEFLMGDILSFSIYKPLPHERLLVNPL